MSNDAEVQALKDENARLLAKNNELLTEKKTAVAALRAAEEKIGVVERAKETLVQQVTAMKLSEPVTFLVDEMASDPHTFQLLLNEKYQFALDEEQKPQFQTKDGKPVVVKTKDGKQRAVAFDAKEISEYLCPRDGEKNDEQKRFARVLVGTRASGGAGNATQASTNVQTTKPAEPQTQTFGLR